MPGTEISLPIGANVKAVADGVVSAVFDLGSGQTVVVRHGKYFTAYSNLSGISVNKGQEIKAGKLLGKSVAGLNGEGQIIFMVQNDKGITLTPKDGLNQDSSTNCIEILGPAFVLYLMASWQQGSNKRPLSNDKGLLHYFKPVLSRLR